MFEEKTIAETKNILNSGDGRGLSIKEVKKRRQARGPNELMEEKGPSLPMRLAFQFMDPLIYILLAAGVISVFLGEA